MDRQDLIGVVTVTYNSAGVLPDFLRCISAQTHGRFILYAVDNESKDSSVEILRRCQDPRIRIVANTENKGVAEGNNQGIRAAIQDGCSSILLLNNDTEFSSTLLQQLLDGLYKHDVDMICPKIMYFAEPNRIWAAGGKFQPCLGYRAVHFGEGEVDHGQYDQAHLVTYVPTCCVLIRAGVFQRIGLMDRRFFVYADDVDFMYRAMKARRQLMYIPEAKLLHKVGRLTGGEDSSFAIRYGTRNRLFFLLKHFGFMVTAPWIVVCEIAWLLRAVTNKKGLGWLALKQGSLTDSLRMYWHGRSAG